MAKNVFKPAEIVLKHDRIFINAPAMTVEEEGLEDIQDEYTGPTADDLRREADLFRSQWEAEKSGMIARASEEAEKIIKDAETAAFEEVQNKNSQAQKARQEAEDEAKTIRDNAAKQAGDMIKAADDRVKEIEKDANDKGYSLGRDEGYASGKAEVERLLTVVHKIIDKAIERRNQIIDESETQLINLVLLISQKVIKVISENQKNVVINNVIQAIRKLKTRGDIIIRVNLEDVQLTSDHIKDFMRMVENIKSITVVEDSTVDKGGCIIETDFGEIDARISSQLHEIQEKVLELAPIRIKSIASEFEESS